MFRRLAEAFEDSGNAGSGAGAGSHDQYIKGQTNYFNALPNMILSGTSGLKGFDTATQSLDSLGQNFQPPVVKNPNAIFIQDSSPDLTKMAKQCASSSIDQLISMKNPNAAIGCGWLYTPPNRGSPYPVTSQGFIGDSAAPLQNFNPPDYKKYYFDLQLAKKQILLDKCKALKACGDVDSDVFNGSCGYCTDTNQGVPIDTVGQPLYGGDPIGSCNPQSIVTSGANCPPPPGTGSGPQPIIDKTCQAVDGRLSATCLYDRLLTAGCSDNGSLAIALSGSPDPNDYLSNFRNGDAVKIYNRVANPPLSLDVFSRGATTVDIVLKEARQLAANTGQPANSAIGASARDMCLQKGALSAYNFCNDLPDTTPSPFDIGCLQQLFRKMGGQPTGLSYPGANTINTYNSMGTLSGVKQYLNTLIQNMSSTDYNTQRNAMIQFLGISPERLITRAPYQQGVEVIWLQAKPGSSNSINGVLKRTMETDTVQFAPGSTGLIPQLASTYPGFSQYSAMLQMFDVRAPTDFTTNFTITIDDSFYVAANQPADIAKLAFSTVGLNQTNLFSNMYMQGPTTYSTENCFNYYAATPNITKIYYTDSGGGGHTLQLQARGCTGYPSFSPPYYSLTCEPRAPFLNFEVLADGSFDDTRNPGLLTNLISAGGLEVHNRPEERAATPGNKAFVRLTNNTSNCNITNIAYQGWGTCSFAFRLQSMPVKDAIFSFYVQTYFCVIYLVPVNGSTAQIRTWTNMTRDGSNWDGTAGQTVTVGPWHYMEVAQSGRGLDIYCDTIDNIVKNGNYTTGGNSMLTPGVLYTPVNNGLYNPGPIGGGGYNCNVGFGGQASGSGFMSASFIFDVAWVHFFDSYINAADVVRDCKADWKFTQFPDSVNTYKTLG